MSTPLKPFLSIDEQVDRLQSRGMLIDDRDEAKRWLAAVGYYRISGYSYPFRQADPNDPTRRADEFEERTYFREVVQLYEFDRHLKSLIHSGLERVEVAMRSQIGHTLGRHGPLAFQNKALFRPGFGHSEWLITAQRRIDRARGRDQFVDHHYDKYGGKLPIWVLTDVLDFADISKLFAGMTAPNQRVVAEWFAVTPRPHASKSQLQRWSGKHPLSNWLLHLTIVRNICAHHNRLWNRQLTPVGTSRIAHLRGFDGVPTDQSEHVYVTICILAYLLESTSPGNTWTSKVAALVQESFERFVHRSPTEMGFPHNWTDLPLWATH
ncbi:MAG TPA: Abi family protein [Aldersonia sp.]